MIYYYIANTYFLTIHLLTCLRCPNITSCYYFWIIKHCKLSFCTLSKQQIFTQWASEAKERVRHFCTPSKCSVWQSQSNSCLKLQARTAKVALGIIFAFITKGSAWERIAGEWNCCLSRHRALYGLAFLHNLKQPVIYTKSDHSFSSTEERNTDNVNVLGLK